jgi:hypothetical protein
MSNGINLLALVVAELTRTKGKNKWSDSWICFPDDNPTLLHNRPVCIAHFHHNCEHVVTVPQTGS